MNTTSTGNTTPYGYGGYVEILYVENSQYYINHKNFIDTIILFCFIIFFFFTMVSLSIKAFNLGRK